MRLQTVSIGHGPVPVVLLNDWMGDHRNYDPVHPYLDTTGFTWVFTDLRGYGLNRDQPGEYTLQEAAADVIETLRPLGPVHLVGHSMSSLVAQQVAASAPDALRSLTLVAPVSPTGMGAPEPVLAWLKTLVDPSTREAALWDRISGRGGRGWARFKLERWADAADPRAVAGYVDMYGTQVVDGVAPAGLRTLALIGDQDDEPFSETTVRAALSGVDDLTVAVCPGAGHYPMQEAPVWFSAQLERFFDSA